MFENRYDLGVVRVDGVEYPGKHEPLIDPLTFEKCQVVFDAHRLSGERTQRHDHFLKGTLFCGCCGSRMMFSRDRGKGGVYEYFTCRSFQGQRLPSTVWFN